MTPTGEADVAGEPNGHPSIEGALEELIEVEERIDLEVAEAEARAERLVEAARQDAGAVEENGSTSLEDAVGALRASIEQECAESVNALVERAELEVERYRGVDELTLRQLAQWVASRVVGGAKAS